MLIEDNPDDIELTKRAFKKNNLSIQIIISQDGAEALDYLFGRGAHSERDTSILPSMVLLDLKLPKVNGMEVLKELRSNELTRLLPVIILSSSREKSDVTKCYRLGANSYIRKPVDFSEFNEAVKQLGSYWLQLNENPNTN